MSTTFGRGSRGRGGAARGGGAVVTGTNTISFGDVQDSDHNNDQEFRTNSQRGRGGTLRGGAFVTGTNAVSFGDVQYSDHKNNEEFRASGTNSQRGRGGTARGGAVVTGTNTISFGDVQDSDHKNDQEFRTNSQRGRGGTLRGGAFVTGAKAVSFGDVQYSDHKNNEKFRASGTNSQRGRGGTARGGAFVTGANAIGFGDVQIQDHDRKNNEEFRAIGGTTGDGIAAENAPAVPVASRYIPPTRSMEDLYKDDIDNQQYYMEIPGADMDVIISGIENQLQFDDWSEMNLHPKLLENIVEHSKYIRPRKIQSRAIPYILEGYDIKALAETGSGKTGAFMIPLIQKILFANANQSQQQLGGKPTPFVIIIEPTRELCLQVYDQGRKFANGTGLKVCKAYGQYNFGNNMGELRAGCQILCATTGRLKHLIGQQMIDVSKVSYFVLDEADEMLKNNFLDDVREILASPEFPSKEQRQTLLFSATFPTEIQELANDILRPNFVMAALAKYNNNVSVNPRVRQNFVQVDQQHKADLLKELLEKEQKEAEKRDSANPNIRRTMVFVQTRRDADRLALFLCENKITTLTINGDRTQHEREAALRDFRSGKVHVLVTTDVCARGIDVKDLDHVINFDLPTTFITYTHRIGRTGRVKYGDATSFVEMGRDDSLCMEIVKTLRDIGQPVPKFLTGDAGDSTGDVTIAASTTIPTEDASGSSSKVETNTSIPEFTPENADGFGGEVEVAASTYKDNWGMGNGGWD